MVLFNPKDTSRENIEGMAGYTGKNQIQLVVVFDVQPAHPLFRPIYAAGVRTILACWGAPICSRMPFWRLGIKKLRLRLSRSKLDGLIFQSQAMADLAIYGRGVPREMIDIVYSGVDTSVFRPARSDYVYKALGFPPERKVVVYAGHMERRKGVPTLVAAAVELLARRRRQDVCFLICGNIGEESLEYERMYSGLDIDPFIRFGGYRPDLPQIYPSCFCGVSPTSGWDSFPRAPLEMAACGLAVIASRLHGLPEAVIDRESGLLCEPGNARALADTIELLLDQPDLAARLGARGRKRCEEELNIAVQRERVLRVFLKRLGIAPPAGTNEAQHTR